MNRRAKPRPVPAQRTESAGRWAFINARKQRELTQKEAAELLECSISMVVSIENGYRKPGRNLSYIVNTRLGIDPALWEE